MDVDVTGENTHSCRCSLSHQSPACALSCFLSMIEYATKPVLIDMIAKCHNVQLPLQFTNLETLRTFVVSHLSSRIYKMRPTHLKGKDDTLTPHSTQC